MIKRARSDEVGSRMHFDGKSKISLGCQNPPEDSSNLKVRVEIFFDKLYQRVKKTVTHNAMRNPQTLRVLRTMIIPQISETSEKMLNFCLKIMHWMYWLRIRGCLGGIVRRQTECL